MLFTPRPSVARATISAWGKAIGGLPPRRGFDTLPVGLCGAIMAYQLREYVPIHQAAGRFPTGLRQGLPTQEPSFLFFYLSDAS